MDTADPRIDLCTPSLNHGSHPLRPGGAFSACPHICAFFNGPDDEYRVLLPFIKDGFECGDRIFHTVDPRRRDEHLQRLTSADIDVTGTRQTGQFEVRNWTDMHLRDGNFDMKRTVGLFQDVATAAKQEGFPLVQFVTHMEWALENSPGVEDLLEYEAQANARWIGREGPFNPVICVYDLTKFSGAMVVDIMRTHPLVIIGGVLQENPHFVPPDEFLRQRRKSHLPGKEPAIEAAESQRLKAGINDLVSVMALPAIWSGSAAPKIFATLLDVLMRMLHLEFAYATYSGGPDGQLCEIFRTTQEAPTLTAHGVGEALKSVRGEGGPRTLSNPMGDGEVTVASLRLGLHDAIGWVVLGSSRIDFPSSIQRLLMNVAANQAAIGLQEVRILSDQKRVATELDVKVALRTQELGDAHHRLQQAFGEIQELKDQLQRENVVLREEVDSTSMYEEIVGADPLLRAVLTRVSKVAPADSTVLITGETGTGKELIARAIHKRSQRANRAFVSVNCAAIPTALIASELFGHEKGAFTGAVQRRLGRFELAQGGTLFLDECGDLPLEIQIALLRVLQEREFERVGSSKPIRADVRLIAATNRDLNAAIVAGTFRSDLYYRLNVFPIEMPSLRLRKDDISILTEYFVQRYSVKLGRKVSSISKRTLQRFQEYGWPGNIRELQNVIERSLILCETDTFSVDESWLPLQSRQIQTQAIPFAKTDDTNEKMRIESVLTKTNGRISGPSGAAVQLHLPASTLESRIRALKIDKNRFKSPQADICT